MNRYGDVTRNPRVEIACPVKHGWSWWIDTIWSVIAIGAFMVALAWAIGAWVGGWEVTL